jgi:NADPH2:quinone reductase
VLNQKGSLFFTRPNLLHYMRTREELASRANDVLSWIADRNLSITIDRRVPLSRAAEAHRLLESRQTTGKLLLIPGA